MKTRFFLTALCLVCLGIFLGWTKFTANSHNISIAVSETDDRYTFTTSYNADNTREVERYINNSIKPNSIAKSENDFFDITTTLNDNTEFYVKESPGKLKIEINKRRNSTASYLRIKRMCEGIKALVAGR